MKKVKQNTAVSKCQDTNQNRCMFFHFFSLLFCVFVCGFFFLGGGGGFYLKRMMCACTHVRFCVSACVQVCMGMWVRRECIKPRSCTHHKGSQFTDIYKAMPVSGGCPATCYHGTYTMSMLEITLRSKRTQKQFYTERVA